MIAKPDSSKQRLAQAASICLCIYIILCDVLIHILPYDRQAEFAAMWQLVCFSLLGLILASAPQMSRRTGILFLAGYWVWLIIARAAAHVLVEALPYEIFRAGAMCCVFYLTCTLEEGGRGRLMTWFCAVAFPLFAAMMILGILVALNVIPEFRIGSQAIVIDLEPQNTGVLRSLRFFGVHRNGSASWFMVMLWLTAAQLVRTNRKWLRAVLAVFGGMLYFTMAMQHCRSVYVSTSVGAGLLAFLLVKDRLPRGKRAVRLLCTGAVVLAVMFGCYKGFGLCNRAAGYLTNPTPAYPPVTLLVTPEDEDEEEVELPEQETEETVECLPQTETPPPEPAPAAPAQDAGVSDNRNFFRDLLTLTMRTEIWAAALKTAFARKKFIVLGQLSAMVTENLQYYSGLPRAVSHTHNVLLQVLTIGGVFGFTLMMGFLYLQLRSAIRVLRGRKMPLEKKIFVITLASLLIYGIGEPLFDIRFTSLCFMLLAGMLAEGRKETV